jgi:hypothetical protein
MSLFPPPPAINIPMFSSQRFLGISLTPNLHLRFETKSPCSLLQLIVDRLCGLVVRGLGYRSGGPGSIPDTTKKKVVVLQRSPLSLVSTTEELLDRKVATPV